MRGTESRNDPEIDVLNGRPSWGCMAENSEAGRDWAQEGCREVEGKKPL